MVSNSWWYSNRPSIGTGNANETERTLTFYLGVYGALAGANSVSDTVAIGLIFLCFFLSVRFSRCSEPFCTPMGVYVLPLPFIDNFF